MSEAKTCLKVVTENRTVGGITNKLIPTDWDDIKFAVFNTKYEDWLYLKDDLTIGVSNALYFIATYLDVSPSKATQIENLKNLLSYMNLKGKDIFQTTSKKPASTPPIMDPSKFTFQNISFHEKARSVRLHNGTTFGVNEVENFWNKIYKDSTSTNNEEKQEIINMACFLFLMMYRCIKKEIPQIYIHVPLSGTNSYRSIFKPNFGITLPPPSSEYVKSFTSTFSPFGPNTLAIATKLIQSWICNKKDPNITGLLNAGCLLALRWNGLGVIGWTLKAAKANRVDFNEMLHKIYEIDDSLVKRQVDGIYEFARRKDLGDSWPWCRLFEDSALFNLSTKANPNLCVICALIVMNDPTEVKKMAQFSRYKYLVTHYTEDAKVIIKSLFPEPCAGTEEAAKILERLAELKRIYGDRLADYFFGKTPN